MSRKAPINFVMFVCPSVLPHGTTRNSLDGFSWNLIFEYFFENKLRKFKFHLNPTRIYIYDYGDFISCSVLLTMKHVSDKSCREKQNRHFMVNNVFRKSFHLWDTVEKYCIPKATNTHSVYEIRNTFPPQQWFHERASMLRYIILTVLLNCTMIFLCSICGENKLLREITYQYVLNL
jgi:hypothetical protein